MSKRILILSLAILASLLGVASPPTVAARERYYTEPYYKSESYLESYRQMVLYYNPHLSNRQVDKIVRAILYYSYSYALDPRLTTAVIACESAFRPEAVSPVGAIGLGQLMPETARGHKVDPHDISLNVHGACRVLCLNLKRYHDDGSYRYSGRSRTLELALAAYNAGPGAVDSYGGIPPYQETIAYVKRVTSEYRRLCGFE